MFRIIDKPIETYADFWAWFQKHEKQFYYVVKNRKNIHPDFFDKLSPQLDALREGYFFLAGMYDEDTVELVFTADGDVKYMVFMEELVEQAPEIKHWKFTAHKPAALPIDRLEINMAGYKFNAENLFFYANDHANYRDEIDISIIHNDLNDDNEDDITTGVYLLLDNYLGELDCVNIIDNIEFVQRSKAEKELVPISKLKSFLTWRQKEFIEKYQGVWRTIQEDEYSVFEAELSTGGGVMAFVNRELLAWDSKASHPWIANLTIKYDHMTEEMPSDDELEALDSIRDSMIEQLPGNEGYLFVAHQLTSDARNIYFACKDFRKPSKVCDAIQKQYKGQFEIDYKIYKDKYWRSFERFDVRYDS